MKRKSVTIRTEEDGRVVERHVVAEWDGDGAGWNVAGLESGGVVISGLTGLAADWQSAASLMADIASRLVILSMERAAGRDPARYERVPTATPSLWVDADGTYPHPSWPDEVYESSLTD